MIREGPKFFSESDSEKFIAKNFKKGEMMWIDNKGKILSLQKRKINNAKSFLNDLLKNHINKSGIPKGLKNDFKKGFKIKLLESISQQHKTKSIVVRFLKEVDQIVGADLEKYGPFKTEDVATLPYENASLKAVMACFVAQ